MVMADMVIILWNAIVTVSLVICIPCACLMLSETYSRTLCTSLAEPLTLASGPVACADTLIRSDSVTKGAVPGSVYLDTCHTCGHTPHWSLLKSPNSWTGTLCVVGCRGLEYLAGLLTFPGSSHDTASHTGDQVTWYKLDVRNRGYCWLILPYLWSPHPLGIYPDYSVNSAGRPGTLSCVGSTLST